MDDRSVSQIKSPPISRAARWAIGLSVSAVLAIPLLGILSALIRQLLDPVSGARTVAPGFTGAIISLALSAAALVAGMRAFRQGDRSWVVLAALILSVLVGGFWVFMILGSILSPQ